MYVTLYNVQRHLVNSEEYFVYRWLRAPATFAVTRFSTFVGASKAISSVLSIRELHNQN